MTTITTTTARTMTVQAHAWIWVLALAVSGPSLSGCGGGQKAPETPAVADDDDDDIERSGSRRASVPDTDDDDDEDLQIEGLKGRLDNYDIQEGIRPHEQALSRCFTSRVGRRRYIGGDVEFQFVVNPDGTVKSVHMLRSDLGAWPMEQCMLDICRGMRFAKPKGNAEADFTMPLSFSARTRIHLWNEVRGAEEVDDAKQATLAACAQETGTQDPQNTWLTIYVGPHGSVMSVGFASPDGPLDENWATCAVDKVKAWTLTDPRGRAKMLYHYNP